MACETDEKRKFKDGVEMSGDYQTLVECIFLLVEGESKRKAKFTKEEEQRLIDALSILLH